MALGSVDTASDRSVFQQIADQLREEITRGRLGAGERLPSEAALIDHYGVARMTIRQALGVLKSEGLVVAEHGRGVFVRPRPVARRLGSDRFARRHREAGHAAFVADAKAAGQQHSVDNVRIDREKAPTDVAELLGVDGRKKVVVRRRRYLLDGHPVEVAASYIPLDVAGGTKIEEPDTGPGGIYARMEEQGYTFGPFHEDIRARMPTPEEITALQLAPGVPVLDLVRVARDASGRALEVCETVMAADSFVLSYDLPAK
ncbi:MAG: UTRA domain-containing protein [Streptosporangiales bacterium]|nr:UTRA domain-containing protein [Streptosporangiales bacterium]